MATGVVIKVDKSMKDLAGEITLLAPTQGEILIDPVYGGQYENGSENGWVYVDGTKTAEADGRTFAFPAIRYEEDSSHTISVISVDTDEQLSYSKGLALLVIGSNAEGTDTSYTSDELVAPKNILALRLTSSESEAGSIEYGYSCDNKETWNRTGMCGWMEAQRACGSKRNRRTALCYMAGLSRQSLKRSRCFQPYS